MWLHLISSLDTEDINTIVDIFLPAIVRELSTGEGPSSIVKQLAGRLGKKLRRKIGDIEYSKMAAEAQTRLNVRRAERKKVGHFIYTLFFCSFTLYPAHSREGGVYLLT